MTQRSVREDYFLSVYRVDVMKESITI